MAMDYFENYENIDSLSEPEQCISDKRRRLNLDDSEQLTKHLAQSLARIFLATHKGKIDKAVDEFKKAT
jgi:hypothetical protein